MGLVRYTDTFILGDSFLLAHDAHIIYEGQPCLQLTLGKKIVIAHPIKFSKDPFPSKAINCITFKRAQVEVKHGAQAFVLWLKPFTIKDKSDDNWLKENMPPSAASHNDPTLVPTRDLHNLLYEFHDVFQEIPAGLPPMVGTGHTIPLEQGHRPPSRPLFRLSPAEVEEAKRQVQELLSKGWIVPSQSPYGAPIMFVTKKDATLRMVIDYRQLNSITVKNKWPLPRIDDIFDQLSRASLFSSIDLTSDYHQIRLAKDERKKTAFRTPFGLYEFKVLPFGLTNAPATFQSTMSRIFNPYIGQFVLVFLDDILVYSRSPKEHLQHLRLVFETLRNYRLFAKLKKCEFNRPELEYLGFIVGRDGLKPDPEKIQAVIDFPTPKNPTGVKSFLGLANQFRKFVCGFAAIARPLTQLTRKSTTFLWGGEEEAAFKNLKHAITIAPVLALPDFSKLFVVKADASGMGIGAVLEQEDRPLAYFSRKFNTAEANYSVGEQELLALHDALLHWRCYLEGPEVLLITDHCPLRYLKTQPMLSRRQARWMELFSRYNYSIKYSPGRKNVADPLSRYPIGDAPQLKSVQIKVSAPVRAELSKAYKKDGRLQSESFLKRVYEKNALFFKIGTSRLFIPNDTALKRKILYEHHDAVLAGHTGINKLLKTLTEKFWWPHMPKDVTDYVSSCLTCQAVNARNRKREGHLMPLQPPDYPWQGISMDFITGLPTSHENQDTILVVVDRLTKMVLLLPTQITIDAEGTADLIFREVVCRFGQPEHVICDRDPRFMSNFFSSLMRFMGTKIGASTAYRPQSNGQTERMNRFVEEVLRAYSMEQNTLWPRYLKAAEFAINNSVHLVTSFTPFFLNYWRHPRVPFGEHILIYEKSPPAERRGNDLYEKLSQAKQAIHKAQHRTAEYYNRNREDPHYEVNQLVWLSTENMRCTKPRKLTKRWCGPFPIEQIINRLAIRLNLPPAMRIHDVFHVSLLKPFVPRPGEKTPYVAPPIDAHADPELEVEYIADAKQIGTPSGRKSGRYKYLVKWAGFPNYDMSFEPESHFNDDAPIRRYWASKPSERPRKYTNV